MQVHFNVTGLHLYYYKDRQVLPNNQKEAHIKHIIKSPIGEKTG